MVFLEDPVGNSFGVARTFHTTQVSTVHSPHTNRYTEFPDFAHKQWHYPYPNCLFERN